MTPPTPHGYRTTFKGIPSNKKICWYEHMDYFTVQIGHAMAHYKTKHWDAMEQICNKLLTYDCNHPRYPRLPTFYAAACKILMAVHTEDKRTLNEAADAYEDNWLSLMASPDLAWEENSPFDEIPPQLGFVSRWHAKFIDIGEKLLFEVASRDSEHMSMIRQCFYELKGDKRDAACSIIRNGVMGMERIPDERLDRDIYVSSYPDEVLDGVCDIIKANRLSNFTNWVNKKEKSLSSDKDHRRRVEAQDMELYRTIMDTIMDNWKHEEYSTMEKYARHLLQAYPGLPRYYRAACFLLQGKYFGRNWEHISKSLDGYLEHWSQPLFDPENFLPRRRHPESYLDFIWRWHRCFISMGEELFDEETYIQDSQSLIDQKLKELDERTRQKVANILRSGDNSLENIPADKLIHDLDVYELEHDELKKIYQVVKKFQLARFADVIEEKYNEVSDEESEAQFTDPSEDDDEDMSDCEEDFDDNDSNVETEQVENIKTVAEDRIDVDHRNDRSSCSSEDMDMDDVSVSTPTNQQKWYITNEVNQLGGTQLRIVFNILRDRVPTVTDWSANELELDVEDIPGDVLWEVYDYLRHLPDGDTVKDKDGHYSGEEADLRARRPNVFDQLSVRSKDNVTTTMEQHIGGLLSPGQLSVRLKRHMRGD